MNKEVNANDPNEVAGGHLVANGHFLDGLRTTAPMVLKYLEKRTPELSEELLQLPLRCCSSSINNGTSSEGMV